MPGTYHEITALPVVVPAAAVAFAVLVWRLHRRAAMSVPRVLVSAVMCVYGAGVVGNTLLPVFIGMGRQDSVWWNSLNLVPLVNTEPADMLRNVLVFVPLGFLLPLVARVGSVRRVLLCGFLVSLGMEALQWVNAVLAQGGHIADINDLLANTLGAPVGYGIFRVAVLRPRIDRWAAAATWPAPRHEAGSGPTDRTP